jgi:hypothetical protein
LRVQLADPADGLAARVIRALRPGCRHGKVSAM